MLNGGLSSKFRLRICGDVRWDFEFWMTWDERFSAGGATIVTQGASASGAQADIGGRVTLTGGSVTTSGTNAFGFYARNGGNITASGAPSVTTSGTGAVGLYAAGSGSSITAGPSITIAWPLPVSPMKAAFSAHLIRAFIASLIRLVHGNVWYRQS